MDLGINKNDGNEELGSKNKLDLSISNLSQEISEKVSVLSDKLLDLKLSKEAFNKTLLIILGSAIFAQPVNGADAYFTWRVDNGTVTDEESFEMCYGLTPTNIGTNCQVLPVVSIPPTCIEDPLDNSTYYEGRYINFPTDVIVYSSVQIIYKNGLKSGFKSIIKVNDNSNYTRLKLDWDKDGITDDIEYNGGDLSVRYGKEIGWCISDGRASWNKIIKGYGIGDKKLIKTNNLDDDIADITLYDPVSKTCDIDLSNNGFGSIDLVNQPCNLLNTDMLLYDKISGKTYLGLLSSDGTGISSFHEQFYWAPGQDIISLDYGENKDKTFSYKKSTGQYFLGTLNSATQKFETQEGYLIPGLDIIDLGDFFSDGRGAFLGRNTIGGKSYVYKLNTNGTGFDFFEIQIEIGEQILEGNFTKDNKKDIIRYDSSSGGLIRMEFNASNNTFSEEILGDIEFGANVISANLRGIGVDDIISYNQTTGNGNINRLKRDNKSFHSFPFSGLPAGLDMYKGDFNGDGIDELFLYDKIEHTPNSGKSNTFLLSSNEDGIGFNGIDTNYNFGSGLDVFIKDINGNASDGIITYNPTTGQTFLFNLNKNGDNWIFNNNNFYLNKDFTIIPGNFDNQ